MSYNSAVRYVDTGRLEGLMQLLPAGSIVPPPTGNNLSLFERAVLTYNVPTLIYLLSLARDADKLYIDKAGFLAAKQDPIDPDQMAKRDEMVELLLNKGADPNYYDYSYPQFNNGTLFGIVRIPSPNRLRLVQLALSKGADPNFYEGPSDLYPPTVMEYVRETKRGNHEMQEIYDLLTERSPSAPGTAVAASSSVPAPTKQEESTSLVILRMDRGSPVFELFDVFNGTQARQIVDQMDAEFNTRFELQLKKGDGSTHTFQPGEFLFDIIDPEVNVGNIPLLYLYESRSARIQQHSRGGRLTKSIRR